MPNNQDWTKDKSTWIRPIKISWLLRSALSSVAQYRVAYPSELWMAPEVYRRL